MQDFVTLDTPQNVQYVEPGPSPSRMKGVATRGYIRGWITFQVTLPALVVDEAGATINLRDLRTASATVGTGVKCVDRHANKVLSWADSESPPVFATIDAVAIQWPAIVGQQDEGTKTALEAGFMLRSEAGGISQETGLGFGALGASPRLRPIAGSSTNKLGGDAPISAATLPRPVVVDYNGATFELVLPDSIVAGTSSTMTISMHGTFGTKGSGFETSLNTGCKKEGSGDEVAEGVLTTRKLLSL